MSEAAIQKIYNLPDKDLERLYDHLHFESDIKKRLVSQIILTFVLRSKFSSGSLPIHGITLLYGPPGTGKTSLAKAVASKAASMIGGKKVRLLEIDPHALTGSALGKSQKEVMKLFRETIVEYAAGGPLVVLLDEVETMAASRQKLSLEANPVDVHRATDAVLTGIDAIASSHPEIIFLCTSNFEEALDEAFISRTDFMLHVGLPEEGARAAIIRDTLETLATAWPAMQKLITDKHLETLTRLSKGLDGRAIRKRVLLALSVHTDVAADPGKLSFHELESTFKTKESHSK